MRIWLTTSWVVLSALLITAAASSQDTKTPFIPVPVDQRNALANRLIHYTDAFRARDWDSLYDLVSDVNKTLNDGTRMGRQTFAQDMESGFDSYRLLTFTPIRTEMTPERQFDVYGCGEFPIGDKKTERVAVAVRAVREHDGWFFTTWDYFDPREPCSNVSDPAWKPSHNLRLSYLPELVCDINVCIL
jgi:hypothetical protein